MKASQPASRQRKANQINLVVYTVTTDDTTFALAKTTEINLCGYKLYKTKHSKLLILETERGKAFKTCTRIMVDKYFLVDWIFSLM